MINAVINKIRQEKTKTENKNNLNSNCDKKADKDEFDEETRLVTVLKKKKRLSQKNIRSLRKLYMIIIYIRASELLYNKFLNAAGRMISIDNNTQWDSWYTINEIACQLEGHVNIFVKNNYKAIRKYTLIPDN